MLKLQYLRNRNTTETNIFVEKCDLRNTRMRLGQEFKIHELQTNSMAGSMQESTDVYEEAILGTSNTALK